MNTEDRTEILSEEEIDEIVERQADDDSAWENPIHVQWIKLSLEVLPFPVSLPSELFERAAFFAELHGEPDTENWLMHVIQEQIEFEAAVLVHLEEYKDAHPAISLPSGIAELVVFFAERHQEPSAKIWIARVIQRRIESEEANFARLKRELTVRK